MGVGIEAMMTELRACLLSRACRIFLGRAYPSGQVPSRCLAYLQLEPEDAVEPLLGPPVCELLIRCKETGSGLRGYAFRLGSRAFPHVKLQMIWHDDIDDWVLSVDTHDAIRVRPTDPDFERLRQLQEENRQLKEQVEQDWEADGLWTFNALLRQSLR
jgi:hypothetical protein